MNMRCPPSAGDGLSKESLPRWVAWTACVEGAPPVDSPKPSCERSG